MTLRRLDGATRAFLREASSSVIGAALVGAGATLSPAERRAGTGPAVNYRLEETGQVVGRVQYLPELRGTTDCSPSTITLYDTEQGVKVGFVNLSLDIRNAIHGLELWPYDD